MIVGWAQLSEHADGDGTEPMPDAMLESVARSALARSGAGDALLEQLDGISIVESASWPVPDPASGGNKNFSSGGAIKVVTMTINATALNIAASNTPLVRPI